MLLAVGADVNAKAMRAQETPLHLACKVPWVYCAWASNAPRRLYENLAKQASSASASAMLGLFSLPSLSSSNLIRPFISLSRRPRYPTFTRSF